MSIGDLTQATLHIQNCYSLNGKTQLEVRNVTDNEGITLSNAFFVLVRQNVFFVSRGVLHFNDPFT